MRIHIRPGAANVPPTFHRLQAANQPTPTDIDGRLQSEPNRPSAGHVLDTPGHPHKAGHSVGNGRRVRLADRSALIRKVVGSFRPVFACSLGISLMETVVALGLFSSAGTAVLMGVRAAHTSSDRVDASGIAENLARNQMEHAMTLAYVAPGGSYESLADSSLGIAIPAGFAVTADAVTYVADDGFAGSIEKVVVTVTRDSQAILVLESLRSGP